jgi:hypothetical protein
LVSVRAFHPCSLCLVEPWAGGPITAGSLHSTWVSSQACWASGWWEERGLLPIQRHVPVFNSPSGRKLLDTRNGEHMMSEAGAGRGQSGPQCQPGSRRVGRTPRPDAMEKETTALAGPAPSSPYPAEGSRVSLRGSGPTLCI